MALPHHPEDFVPAFAQAWAARSGAAIDWDDLSDPLTAAGPVDDLIDAVISAV